MSKKMQGRAVFIIIFLMSAIYILFIKTELYESSSALIVKDLNDKSAAAGIGLNILGTGVSSQMQDSKILEEYFLSLDVLKVLDAEFALKQYYHSDALDIFSRLTSFSTKEDFLRIYRKHLHIVYDEISGILHLSFLHSDPETAQKIVKFLIAHAEKQLNVYSARNAEKQLKFIRTQVEQNRRELDASTEELEKYQNEHLVLDPLSDAQSQSSIIATLEALLVEKRSEYNQMKRYMSESSFDLVKLKNEIKEIESSLAEIKANLTGKGSARLNTVLFAYEKLKTQVEFDKEIYKESLVQLEVAAINANKEAKTLVVLTETNLPDGYSYPDKPKVLTTLLIMFLLTYGILSLILAIIKDHRD